MNAQGIISAITERERTARRMLVDRAGVTRDDLRQAAQTLSRLGAIGFDDLVCAPAFDALGNANVDTSEWRQWAAVQDLVDEARRLGHQLGRAYFESSDPA